MKKYIWECCRLLGANSENAIASMQKTLALTSIFCLLTLPVLAEPINTPVQKQVSIHAIASNTSKVFVPAFRKKRHNNNIWLGFNENQLNQLTVNLDSRAEFFESSEWTIVNSFSAAYVTWKEKKTSAIGKQNSNYELERYFDYEDTPLNEFYSLSYATNHSFITGKINHENTVGIDLIKNPFALSRENTRTVSHQQIPSSFVESDFLSKKNFLSFYVGHEIALTNRFSLYFEGTLDLVIPDTTDLPDLPTLSPQEYNNFSPELELSYQLTDSISLYLSYSYFREPIEGSFFTGEPLQPETYQSLEAGIDAGLFSDKFFASLYFFNENQNNITTLDPLFPDFDTQVNEQNNQSLGLQLTGEIVQGWDVILYYAYTDARIVEDDRLNVGNRVEDVAEHSGGFWTTYEIQTATLKGLGFGGGCWIVGSRPGDFENSFSLSAYLQTDAVLFYRSDDLKVAVTVQNLFNKEVNTSDGIPLTIIGTVWAEF